MMFLMVNLFTWHRSPMAAVREAKYTPPADVNVTAELAGRDGRPEQRLDLAAARTCVLDEMPWRTSFGKVG
jgi:hypothetical protein